MFDTLSSRQSVEVSNLLTRAHFVDVGESALLLDLSDLFEQIFVESELLFRHLLTTVRSVDLQSLQRSNSLLRLFHDTHRMLAPSQICFSFLSHLLLVFSYLEIDLLLVQISLLLSLQLSIAFVVLQLLINCLHVRAPEERLFCRPCQDVVLVLFFLLLFIFDMKLILECFFLLHLGNDVAEIHTLTVGNLLATNVLVLFDL